jgi:raffinose/stachyose/melibiose transport system permease protein
VKADTFAVLPRRSPGIPLLYIVLTLLSLLTIAPLVWIVFLSFKSKQGFAASPFGLPESINLDNYITVLTDERLLQYLGNSIVVTTTSVLLILVVCLLAGYALARIEFRGNTFLFVVFFLSDAVPIFVVLVPLFILIQQLGIADTLWSLILPYAAMHIGVAVFLFRGFFRSISSEIEDAARIDGCNTLQMLWFVLLPLIRPAVLVVMIVNFISIWNEYFLAAILLPSQELFTLPPGLAAAFLGKYSTNWPVMAAGIVLSVLPVFALFLLAQDKIVEGWTVGHK